MDAAERKARASGRNVMVHDANGELHTVYPDGRVGGAWEHSKQPQRLPNAAKGLTLRNMALVTIRRLPGGAVAISGKGGTLISPRISPLSFSILHAIPGASMTRPLSRKLPIWRPTPATPRSSTGRPMSAPRSSSLTGTWRTA